MNTATVTSIRSRKKEIRPLGESIELIINRIKSKNTAKNYKGFYKEFFTYIFGKSYLDTSWDELESLTYDDVLEYVSVIEVKNNPNTVQTKIASIQSLVKELKKINNNINTVVFDVKISAVEKKGKKNEYGAFTEEECYALLDYCKNLNSDKAYVQYMFFKLTLCTAHRLQSLLSLTWKNLIQKKDGDVKVWCLELHDKTDDFLTPISDSLANELYAMYNGNNDERILKISDKTLALTLTRFCEANNIDKKSRNLTIHSLKKSAGDLVYNLTNDIVKTSKFLHHTSVQTSYNRYLGKNTNLTESPSYTMFSKSENVDELLSGLSKEELIEVIKGCNVSVVSAICNKIKESR